MAMQVGLSRANGVGYAAERITKPPNWHTLVALDMLFNNLTTGLFLVAAAGDLAAPGTFATAARVAYPVAMVLLLADLLCLVLDLGHRLRFHHMLRVFKPSSPMSLGTWCLTTYSLPLTLLAAIEVLRFVGIEMASGPALGWIRLLAVVAGIPFALGSAMYKGVLFSTTSQPGWRDARWLGGYLTNSAIAIGCAELLAIATVMGQGAAASALRLPLFILLAINMVFLSRLIHELRPALRAVTGGDRLESMLILGAIAGVGVPFLLLILVRLFPGGIGLFGDLTALSSIVLGNFLVRRAIVLLPHRPLAAPADRDGR